MDNVRNGRMKMQPNPMYPGFVWWICWIWLHFSIKRILRGIIVYISDGDLDMVDNLNLWVAAIGCEEWKEKLKEKKINKKKTTKPNKEQNNAKDRMKGGKEWEKKLKWWTMNDARRRKRSFAVAVIHNTLTQSANTILCLSQAKDSTSMHTKCSLVLDILYFVVCL